MLVTFLENPNGFQIFVKIFLTENLVIFRLLGEWEKRDQLQNDIFLDIFKKSDHQLETVIFFLNLFQYIF